MKSVNELLPESVVLAENAAVLKMLSPLRVAFSPVKVIVPAVAVNVPLFVQLPETMKELSVEREEFSSI